MTVRDEPLDRLSGALEALRDAVDAPEATELVLAAPPGDATASIAVGCWPGPRQVVDNPTGERSRGLNRAAAAASGEVLVRIDARTRVRSGYVRRCVEVLHGNPTIGVVGGHQVPMPGSSSFEARAIARALQNPYVTGAAAYRVLSASGPVETVYLGVFRRQEFLARGGFDEALLANEDFDLCQRYRQAGQIVWLIEGLDVDYLARTTVRGVWGQYHAFGRAKVGYWRHSGGAPLRRQAAALVGSALLAVAGVALLSRPKTIPLAVLGGTGLLVGLDQIGNRRPASGPERLGAVAASVAVVAAWVTGALSEAVRPTP